MRKLWRGMMQFLARIDVEGYGGWSPMFPRIAARYRCNEHTEDE